VSEPFPIWCTKWCLSSGIEEATAWEFPGTKEWCVVATGRLRGTILQSGQWWRTRAAAVKEANKVLRRVIEQQRERLEELESIVFGGDDHEGTSDRAGEGSGSDETGREGQHQSPL
jgi:hypothetical protein